MRFANSGLALLLAVSIVSFHSAVFAGETLDAVKARGYLIVGVNGELYGFGMPDEKGVWRGLNVDTGRAIAAAIFGDPGKIRFVTLTTQTRFTALKFKEVNVLCRNASKTLTHEAELGLDFVAVNYYDGQGFLIRKKLGVKNARELNGAAVCVMRGTTSKRNAANFFRSNKIAVKPVLVEQSTELNQALFTGKCDCLTSRRFPVGRYQGRSRESERLCYSAGSNLQGAAGAGRTVWGQAMARYRGFFCPGDDSSRRLWHYIQERR